VEHGYSTSIIESRPLLVSRFEVVDLLGEGSAGAVYRVKDRERGDKEVALKILNNQEAFDENTLQRFFEELRICQTLNHPNLVKAYELIESEEVIAFTMEYVDGSDLRIFIGTGRVPFDMLDSIFEQLLSALELLHTNGIIHRDIKLENILIDKKGVVKLTDLGLVKNKWRDALTRTGVRLGTLPYMPPEYVKRGQYDARSDIYTTGIMLYELLSGKRRLIDRPGNEALQYLIRTKFRVPRIRKTGVPQKYHYIVQKAMNPSPRKRFQSASDMREAFIRPKLRNLRKVPAGNPTIEPKIPRSMFEMSKEALTSMQLIVKKRIGLEFKVLIALIASIIATVGIFYWLLNRSPLHDLNSGSYHGMVNGISAVGSLDQFQAFVGSNPGFTLNTSPCRILSSSREGTRLSCQGNEYALIIRQYTGDQFSGVLNDVKTGREHPFFLERK
jgi:eukaryotic-like serine/threonine-protein kinase